MNLYSSEREYKMGRARKDKLTTQIFYCTGCCMTLELKPHLHMDEYWSQAKDAKPTFVCLRCRLSEKAYKLIPKKLRLAPEGYGDSCGYF
jgi:hypothetical protein